jgi:hypothetical protein
VPSRPFASRARNAEDVVVWRALGHVAAGRAIELGEPDAEFSSLRALSERGWQILHLADPVAAADADGIRTWAGHEVHVLAGGGGAQTVAVLEQLALDGIHPWVVVADCGGLAAPERLHAAGYRHCSFDGVNDVFVHDEHAELTVALGHPACSRDDFSTPDQRRRSAERDALQAELDDARRSVAHWRSAALRGWDGAVARGATRSGTQRELDALRDTVSWRVTRPLRAVRRRMPTPGSGG